MADYSKATSAQIAGIAAQYGLDIIDFSPIQGGNANSNYHLQTKQGEYALTIAEKQSFQGVVKLAELLTWLNAHGSPTSQVVHAQTAEPVLLLGNKPIMIKHWVPGEVHEDLSTSMLQQIGRALAKLHQVPVPPSLPPLATTGLEVFRATFELITDQAYHRWLYEQLDYLQQNIPEYFPKGLIHADLFFDNVIFENGHLQAIIDFEDACHYFLHFDLGMCIVGLCRTEGEVDFKKVNALVKGYEELRTLSLAEQEKLLFFAEFAATVTSWWRYWKYNIHIPSEKKKNKHWEMADLAREVRGLVG